MKIKRQSQIIKAILSAAEEIESRPYLTLEGELLPAAKRQVERVIKLSKGVK